MNVLNLEECELLCDSKYRAYVSQVDKALKAFEYTSEWADLISALGKLNKVLSTHIRYPVIPKRVTIGKRLAQCLHPALPSGVHLKVLETYDIIFKCIGTTRLASDLFTYGSGLFPLMGYAAMNVRPVLLQLYETHFIALQKHVKPALTGLIMGLLPGLEEGSEHFDRTSQLLEEFCEAAESSFFYGCIWECVLASATNRFAGINFVLSHFNRKQSMEDQLFFMGTNLDILVKALCVSLQDNSILVQRSTLDLLTSCFPIYNSQLPKSDMNKLLTAAIKVVLRRDMSLNRRLYAWLLGCDSNGIPLAITVPATGSGSEGGLVERQDSTTTIANEMDYFNIYSKEMLIVAVCNSLLESGDSETGKVVNLKPFKVLMSLLDKPEIGSAILEDILMEIFRCMYRECITNAAGLSQSAAGKDNVTSEDLHVAARAADDKGGVNSEIVKTANLLFGAFEPYFIWQFISQTFREACKNAPTARGGVFGKGDASVTELCLVVDFLLDKLTVEAYKETQTEHLPSLLQCLMSSLAEYIDHMTDNELLLCLNLSSKILSRVQPSVMLVNANVIEENLKQRNGSTASDGVQDKEDTNSPDHTQNQTHLDSDILNNCVAKENAKDCDTHDVTRENSNSINCELVSDDGQIDSNDVGTSISSKSATDKDGAVRTQDSEFCDFVQFENNGHTCSSVNNEREKGKDTRTNLQNCIEGFVKLFEAFLTKRLLADCNLPKIMQLLGPRNCTKEDKGWTISSGTSESDAVNRLPLNHVSLGLCEAFASACQLLVEFSSLPIFCTSNYKEIQKSFQQVSDFTFPNWLQLLLICACAIKNFSVESAAITAVLDLIGLTRSFIGEVEHKGGRQSNKEFMGNLEDQCFGDNTVSVLILPLLTPNDLIYMNEKTNFYQLVGKNLWNYLDDSTPAYHSRTVELLYQLQQLSPDPWTCEDVISSALLSDNKKTKFSAHRKFAIFWHLLRDRATATPCILPIRTFDRSLLVMLDSLLSDVHLSSSLTQTWLLHAIQRGDLMRILEPLILILFHPDTARVSIQHVSIHKPRRLRISMSERSDENSGAGEFVETNIFAISNEGGNIIYHVGNSGKLISRKVSEELRTYALSFVSEKGSATKTSRTNVENDLVYMQVNPSDVNLTVNPFGSQHSLDGEVFDNGSVKQSQLLAVRNAKRLTKTTCEEERIFFDDNEHDPSVASQESEVVPCCEDLSPELIVRSILDDIVDEVVCYSCPVASNTVDVVDSVDENQVKDEHSPSKERILPLDFDYDPFTHVDHISDIESQSDTGTDEARRNSSSRYEELPNVHPLHTHILLYMQKYDARRTLYAFNCLKAVISTSPHVVTVALTTSNIGSSMTPHANQVLNLLIRHRRSVLGKNFHGELPTDASVGVRSSMFVEVLISICLFYVRGYYPNLMMSKLSDMELNANKEIQIISSDCLAMILSELTAIAHNSGRGVATYISELLLKCKVQKALLYSLMASVYNSRSHVSGQEESIDISESIINFNDECMDADTNETLQIKLIKLLLSVITLEDQILHSKVDGLSKVGLPPEYERACLNAHLSAVHYLGNVPVVYQPMLLSAVVNMLRQQHMCHMHRHWMMMVISAMPFLGRALVKIVLATVNQLCRNLELLAQLYELGYVYRSLTYKPDRIPPDHVVTLLEGLTTICHYCLLDSIQQDVGVIGAHGQSVSPASSATSASSLTGPSDVNSGRLVNLSHVFQLGLTNRDASPSKETMTSNNPRLEARSHILNILPRILASLAVLWKSIHISEKKEQQGATQAWWTLGAPKMVRHCILEFLSPVALHHAQHLMAAVAVVWNERRQRGPASIKKVIPVAAEDQLILVDLISTVKLLPLDTIMQTVKHIIRQPGQMTTDTIRKRVPLEVGLLRFLYAYIQRVDGPVLGDTWPLLLSLFKEGLQINLVPPGQFILLSILNEFLQKIATFEERKDQKDLQEITQKLLEACSEIAGSSLEQVTFFRRNLAVKPGKQIDVSEMDELTTDIEVEGPELPQSASVKPAANQVASATHTNNSSNQHQYSVQALILLSEVTATLLDVVYRSEEKERVIPLLNNILYNVFPYLKNHSANNLPSYRACSQMLSSLSSYQYTRKTWKKEAFDLLLDNNFFQMDEQCIKSWMTTIDNLMTHDRGSSFRDFLIRVNATQSSSLNLFGSREAEFEQRAQLLKRLAFTIFCSEVDQYQKHMPDIQEKLADCLRLSSVLNLQAQVFLCFRVLILRISPQYLTSLWPTIITELVHVMLQIEQELAPETEVIDGIRLGSKHRSHMVRMNPSWTAGNGVISQNNPAWVSACKLLDLCLTLPADLLPQFQLYRWAFVADPSGLPQDNEKRKIREQPPSFVPHVVRIARLMMTKFDDIPLLPRAAQHPLLTAPWVCSVQDLCSFFVTIYSMLQDGTIAASTTPQAMSPSVTSPQMQRSHSVPNFSCANPQTTPFSISGTPVTPTQLIEQIIVRDFLDPIQSH